MRKIGSLWLAAGLEAAAGVALTTHGDDVFSVAEGFRDIKGEWRVAAAVNPHGFSVYKNLRRVISRLKIEQCALTFMRMDGKCPSVPAGADKILVSNAGQLAFGAEGNVDPAFQFFFVGQAALSAGAAEIKFKVPLAAEICPVLTDKLGTRIGGSCHDMNSFQI